MKHLLQGIARVTFGTGGNLFGGTLCNNSAALVARFRAEID